MGMTNSWMSAPTIPHAHLTDSLILRAWTWFNNLLEQDPRQSAGAFVLFEIMQPVSIRMHTLCLGLHDQRHIHVPVR
jgi:hypothetical protein